MKFSMWIANAARVCERVHVVRAALPAREGVDRSVDLPRRRVLQRSPASCAPTNTGLEAPDEQVRSHTQGAHDGRRLAHDQLPARSGTAQLLQTRFPEPRDHKAGLRLHVRWDGQARQGLASQGAQLECTTRVHLRLLWITILSDSTILSSFILIILIHLHSTLYMCYCLQLLFLFVFCSYYIIYTPFKWTLKSSSFLAQVRIILI